MSNHLSEKEIDEIVTLQASDDNAWEEWESVNPEHRVSLNLSENTIRSLKRIANLKGEKGLQQLVKKWIDERLIFEQKIINETQKLVKG